MNANTTLFDQWSEGKGEQTIPNKPKHAPGPPSNFHTRRTREYVPCLWALAQRLGGVEDLLSSAAISCSARILVQLQKKKKNWRDLFAYSDYGHITEDCH